MASLSASGHQNHGDKTKRTRNLIDYLDYAVMDSYIAPSLKDIPPLVSYNSWQSHSLMFWMILYNQVYSRKLVIADTSVPNEMCDDRIKLCVENSILSWICPDYEWDFWINDVRIDDLWLYSDIFLKKPIEK